jgi:hypothetical protein
VADFITELARAVAVGIWAILGLFFWIPLICKAFFIQTAVLLTSAFVRRQNNNYEHQVKQAVNFYRSGFETILSDNNANDQNDLSLVPFKIEDIEKLLPDLVFFCIFWLTTLIVVFT